MKKVISAVLILAAVLMLVSCGGDRGETSSQTGKSSGTSSGIYNGRAVTMKVAVVTDLKWHEKNIKTSVFVNDFAAIYFYNGSDDSENDGFAGAFYMDKNGHLINDTKYMMLKDFNDDGLALALGMDGVYYVLDTTGRVVETKAQDSKDLEKWSAFNYENPYSDEEGFVGGHKIREMSGQLTIVDTSGKKTATLTSKNAEAIREASVAADGVVVCVYGGQNDGRFGKYMQLYDTNGKLLNDTKFERIGNFYKGLAPIYKDGKLGLISDKGETVISPSVPCSADSRFIAFNEDRIIVSIDGNISIIEVSRS